MQRAICRTYTSTVCRDMNVERLNQSNVSIWKRTPTAIKNIPGKYLPNRKPQLPNYATEGEKLHFSAKVISKKFHPEI